jgi:hypothetical protein
VIAETLERFGRRDGLVNNAGIALALSAALSLACDPSRFVTGSELVIDGG